MARMIAARIASGAALALLAAPAWADVKAGVDAWTAGDFSRAVVEWQGPAAAGDPDALFNLAQAYRLGRGVEVDNARARRLYEQAAALGHVKAADNYGLMLFQEGEQERAMPMVRAAAERGDPRAQYVLGLSHFNADYAPRDWVRAYALMTLASGSGLPQARDALAQMDNYVPQAQRSAAQSLARELEAGAKAQRSAELASAELAARPPRSGGDRRCGAARADAGAGGGAARADHGRRRSETGGARCDCRSAQAGQLARAAWRFRGCGQCRPVVGPARQPRSLVGHQKNPRAKRQAHPPSGDRLRQRGRGHPRLLRPEARREGLRRCRTGLRPRV